MTDIANGTQGNDVTATAGSNAATSTDNVSQNQETKEKKDTVSYETYSRTLSKLKKLEQEYDLVQKQKEADAQKLLEEQGQWKLVAESERKKNAELTGALNERDKMIQDAIKMSAFLKMIPGSVDSDYHSLINLDEIIIDPDTKKPDAVALETYSKAWLAKHSRLVDRQSTAKVPTEAPKSFDVGQTRTIAEMATQLASMRK